jgi:hypothetical protein
MAGRLQHRDRAAHRVAENHHLAAHALQESMQHTDLDRHRRRAISEGGEAEPDQVGSQHPIAPGQLRGCQHPVEAGSAETVNQCHRLPGAAEVRVVHRPVKLDEARLYGSLGN